jgi:hypothetical protein
MSCKKVFESKKKKKFKILLIEIFLFVVIFILTLVIVVENLNMMDGENRAPTEVYIFEKFASTLNNLALLIKIELFYLILITKISYLS